jgi:hypothetical protein
VALVLAKFWARGTNTALLPVSGSMVHRRGHGGTSNGRRRSAQVNMDELTHPLAAEKKL